VIETDADSLPAARRCWTCRQVTGVYAKYARLVGSASHGAVTSMA
jgi:hypothetical protein